jgi:hypothetical protein
MQYECRVHELYSTFGACSFEPELLYYKKLNIKLNRTTLRVQYQNYCTLWCGLLVKPKICVDSYSKITGVALIIITSFSFQYLQLSCWYCAWRSPVELCSVTKVAKVHRIQSNTSGCYVEEGSDIKSSVVVECTIFPW